VLQSTTNLQTLKELQNIEASFFEVSPHNTKKIQQKHQIQKRKQKNGLPLNNQITQHCTSWGNNRVPD
jgi:hypothetical protein